MTAAPLVGWHPWYVPVPVEHPEGAPKPGTRIGTAGIGTIITAKPTSSDTKWIALVVLSTTGEYVTCVTTGAGEWDTGHYHRKLGDALVEFASREQ